MNPTPQLTSDWVNYREAAAYLGVSVPTIRNWCRSGLLEKSRPTYKTVRISAASIERMMEKAKQPRTITVTPFTRTIHPRKEANDASNI